MAQVELRFFTDLGPGAKAEIAEESALAVNHEHYGKAGLEPGNITLVVPALDLILSSSDASYELEISEGSDNWPRDETGQLLVDDLAKQALEDRARRISAALSIAFTQFSHNIFEVNGIATGWVQYKPSEKRQTS